MTFNNPVVGGDTLIRAAIRSPNYRKGLAGWAINADGSAEFNNLKTNGVAQGPTAAYDSVSANKSLLYKGAELNTLLTNLPQGYTYRDSNGSVASTAFTGSGAEITEVSFIQQPGRAYRVKFFGVHGNVDTVGRVLTSLIPTSDGTAPLVGSNAAESSFDYFATTGVVYTTSPLEAEGVWGPDNSTIRIGAFITKYDGGGGNYFTGSGNYIKPIRLTVEDMGPNSAGGRGWNPPATPPVVHYDQTWNATAIQTYQANGQKSIASNSSSWAYQGDGTAVGNPGGNQFGFLFFDSASIRAALSGATILSTYIYLHNLHSYSNSGVETVIGSHNADPVPGTYPGATGDIMRYFVAEGGSFTTGDVTSWLGTGLQNGTVRGIIVGAADVADISHYGYFDSASIRIVYNK